MHFNDFGGEGKVILLEDQDKRVWVIDCTRGNEERGTRLAVDTVASDQNGDFCRLKMLAIGCLSEPLSPRAFVYHPQIGAEWVLCNTLKYECEFPPPRSAPSLALQLLAPPTNGVKPSSEECRKTADLSKLTISMPPLLRATPLGVWLLPDAVAPSLEVSSAPASRAQTRVAVGGTQGWN